VILGPVRFVAAAALCLVMGAAEILLLPIDRKRGRVFHALARAWAHMILFVSGIRVHVTGLEHLVPGQSYVYVSNHASLFDIPCVLAGIPDQIRIIYKRELETIPFFGWGLKWGHYIGVERKSITSAMQSLAEAVGKIRAGASVLLYAEGTRTKDGRLQPFKRGAFKLAAEAAVPVIPLVINGTFHILRRHSIVIRPTRVHLVLEEPIPADGIRGKEAEVKIMERVRAAIEKNYIDQS